MEPIFVATASGTTQIDEAKYREKKKKSSLLNAVADMRQFSYKKYIVIEDAYKILHEIIGSAKNDGLAVSGIFDCCLAFLTLQV